MSRGRHFVVTSNREKSKLRARKSRSKRKNLHQDLEATIKILKQENSGIAYCTITI